MWPWGHLAIAYLLYSLSSRLRLHRPPSGVGALAVAIGSQFPDLVDKPLAWSFGVLPSGRSLAHSLILAVPMVGLVWLLERRRDGSDAAIAFSIGYLSHLVTDAAVHVYYAEYAFLSYLAWPLLPPPPYGEEAGFIGHLAGLEPTPWVLAQVAMALVVFGVWWSDGRPGVTTVRAFLGGRAAVVE